MRVPQRVRRFVRAADAEPVQPAGEPASNGLVAQRFAPASPGAANKEHERAGGVERAFVQHVAVDCVQRARLMQIHHPLVPGLRPGAPRVVITLADRDSPTPVGDVVQLQAQHLAGTQPPIEHQQEDRQIPQCGETGQQRTDVPCTHRPRQPQRQPHPDRPAHRLLTARRADERPVPLRDPAQRMIDAPLHRILPYRVLLSSDRPLEEARRRCQHPLHRGRREQPSPLGRDRQAKPLRRTPGRHPPQVGQELQRR